MLTDIVSASNVSVPKVFAKHCSDYGLHFDPGRFQLHRDERLRPRNEESTGQRKFVTVSTFVFADAANSAHKSLSPLGTQVSEEAEEALEPSSST